MDIFKDFFNRLRNNEPPSEQMSFVRDLMTIATHLRYGDMPDRHKVIKRFCAIANRRPISARQRPSGELQYFIDSGKYSPPPASAEMKAEP